MPNSTEIVFVPHDPAQEIREVQSPWPATTPTLVCRAVSGFAIGSSKASRNGTAASVLRDEMVNMAVPGCQFDSLPAIGFQWGLQAAVATLVAGNRIGSTLSSGPSTW